MTEYFKSRLQELRDKHRDTGEIEWLYRYRELLRAYEAHQVKQLDKGGKHDKG